MDTSNKKLAKGWTLVHETSRYTLLTNAASDRFLLTRTSDREPLSWLLGEDAADFWRLYSAHVDAGVSLADIDRLLLAPHDFPVTQNTLRPSKPPHKRR